MSFRGRGRGRGGGRGGGGRQYDEGPPDTVVKIGKVSRRLINLTKYMVYKV